MSPEEFVISESEAKEKEEKKDQPKEMSEEDKTLKLANIKRSQINLTFGIAAVIVVLVIFLIFNSISLVPPTAGSKKYIHPSQYNTNTVNIERIPFSIASFGFGSTVHIEITLINETNKIAANMSIIKKNPFVDNTLKIDGKTPNQRLEIIKIGAKEAVILSTNKPERELTFDSNIVPGEYYIILSDFTDDFDTDAVYRIAQNPIGPIVPYVSVICSIFVVVGVIYLMYLRKQRLIISPKPKKEKKEAPVPEASITIKTAPTVSQPIGAGMSPTTQTQFQGATGAMAPPMGYPPQQPYPQPQYPPRQQPPVQPRYPPQQPYPEQRADLSESPYEEAKEREEFDVLAEEPYDLLNPPEAGEEEAAELEPAEEEEEEALEPSKEEEMSPKKQIMEKSSVSKKEMVSAICPTCSLELTAPVDECPKEVTCNLCGTKTVIKRR
jgi:DNA-directed RNA polymerase subunit RPC12/RpoP